VAEPIVYDAAQARIAKYLGELDEPRKAEVAAEPAVPTVKLETLGTTLPPRPEVVAAQRAREAPEAAGQFKRP